MGYLSYEGRVKLEIDDRTLAHLQIVITDKLRRGEPLTLTWRDATSTGGGRTAVWISRNSSLVFRYHDSRQPGINRDWLEALAVAANAVAGLRLVREPAAVAPVKRG